MDNSKFIAGLIGPTLFALGSSVLINRAYLSEAAVVIARDSGLILLSGLLLMVGGLAIVLTHRSWSGWPAIITCLGWLAIVGGLVRVFGFSVGPDIVQAIGFGPRLLIVAGGTMAALGAFLSYKAFLSQE